MIVECFIRLVTTDAYVELKVWLFRLFNDLTSIKISRSSFSPIILLLKLGLMLISITHSRNLPDDAEFCISK